VYKNIRFVKNIESEAKSE